MALGVCGGIAAYKVVEVARQLTQNGADVKVVMSPSAVNFVGALTFSTLTGNPIRSELFPETAAAEIVHTDLGRSSDLILIAPATAKTIAKYALGISDDLMSALLLSAACPIVMAPAMHTEMWDDAATRANVATLAGKGVTFVGPESGALAGPDHGVGRLAAIESILQVVDRELAVRVQLEGVRILVTAGGTMEPIDAVRFIGNRSSGLMGYEIARESVRRGAKVSLISGPSSLQPPAAADLTIVQTAREMKEAVDQALDRADVLIMAAAVADWRPASVERGKLRKSQGPPEIDLEPTEDILELVGARRVRGELPGLKVLVGFCAETGDLGQAALEKLRTKHADLMVANEVGTSDSGFDVETNRAMLVKSSGADEQVFLTKRMLAGRILDEIGPSLGGTTL